MMDPNTGEILAIGNRPTYNNNHYNDYDPSIYNRSLPVFQALNPVPLLNLYPLRRR